jgi:hypothetical protein
LTHSPDAVTHSPAEITAAWPTTVISSRWPRALIRRTQKPFAALWKVTRSTGPASTSRSDGMGSGFMMFCDSSMSGGPRGRSSTDAHKALGSESCRTNSQTTDGVLSDRCSKILRPSQRFDFCFLGTKRRFECPLFRRSWGLRGHVRYNLMSTRPRNGIPHSWLGCCLVRSRLPAMAPEQLAG